MDIITTSDEEEDDADQLPFLFSQQLRDQVPLHEQTQQYWEYCYGKDTITIPAGSLPNVNKPSSWSANRKPPTKGW